MSEPLNQIDLEAVTERYSVDPEPFVYYLPEGEPLAFRPIARKSELDALMEAAATWYMTLPKKGSAEAQNHPWVDWLPENGVEAMNAFIVSSRSVAMEATQEIDGITATVMTPKIDLLTALKWLRAPWLIRELMDTFDAYCKNTSSLRLAKLVKDAKKNSPTTLGNASSEP